jgi:cell division transport system permease protein
MLDKISAYLVFHFHAAITSLNFLCRRPLATGMTIVVIAITLALPTLFWVFNDNLAQLTANWQRGGHISLYLKMPIAAKDEISFLDHIRQTAGVGHATLKTAAEGLAELETQEGMQEIRRYLPENPLPTVIEVVPALDINTPAKLEQLYAQLKTNPQVDQAKLDMQWIERLHAILGFVAKTAHGLMLLLALAVVLIIGNTLRLAIHNRHEEIQVLKLIGATDPYIIRPFLYSGIWYGFGGAILAVLFVNIFILSLVLAVNQLAEVYQMHYSILGLTFRQILLLIGSAIFLGWLGARLSVKSQLASIEPYN